MHYRKLWLVVLMLVLVLAQGQIVLAAGNSDTAPLLNADSQSVIPGEYIVVFKPGAPGKAVDAALAGVQQAGGSVHFRYTDTEWVSRNSAHDRQSAFT